MDQVMGMLKQLQEQMQNQMDQAFARAQGSPPYHGSIPSRDPTQTAKASLGIIGHNRMRDISHILFGEKHFRRMLKFEGDSTKFRAWIFDLLVAIGQVDDRLAVALKQIMKKDALDVEQFVPGIEDWIDQALYDKYRSESYGI